MYKFNDLLKASNSKLDGKELRIAVLGNCSTQLLSKTIQGNCRIEGINANVFDADYNQIDLQLYNFSSETFSFNPEIIILWLSSEKLYEDFLDLDYEQKTAFADNTISKIKSYWEFIKKHSSAKIVQFDFCNIDDMPLGNYSLKAESSFSFQLRKLNQRLEEAMKETHGVFPVGLSLIQSRVGQKQLFDPVLYYSSKMPISLNAFPYVTQQVVSVVKSILGKIKKCLIMDLDNTIWGGVIGDDGIDKIEIGEFGRGHVFTNLQKWIKQLKECGIILAVCSKNNEDTAKLPFEKHSEMVLRLSDISVFVANWNDKASNIKLIQETLNIGMDSIVFIDDNPFERNLVKELIPDITVPDLPDDPSNILEFLIEQNYFEVASYIGVNSDRTAQYQAQYERKKMEMSFESIDDYLVGLEMTCNASPFEQSKYARIAQLSQRSNQFNLRTVRYTDEDIERISKDKSYITLSCSLKDKFGDYGLVSIAIIKRVSDDIGFIENWLMSCRALKRGLEEFTINKVISLCKREGIRILKAEYIPTIKNAMVKDMYKTFGFKETSENNYKIFVDDYKNKKTFIKEE